MAVTTRELAPRLARITQEPRKWFNSGATAPRRKTVVQKLTWKTCRGIPGFVEALKDASDRRRAQLVDECGGDLAEAARREAATRERERAAFLRAIARRGRGRAR